MGRNPKTTLAELDQRVAEIEDIAATLERKQLDTLNATLEANQKRAELLAAPLYGELQTTLDKLNGRAIKQGGKLYKNLQQCIDNCYTYAFPYGAINPTPDRIAYALETGDSLGALGFNPPPTTSSTTGGIKPVPSQPGATVGGAIGPTPVPPKECPEGFRFTAAGPPTCPDLTGCCTPFEPFGTPPPPPPAVQPPPPGSNCLVGWNYSIYLRYQDGNGGTLNPGWWHEAWTQLGTGEPPGEYKQICVKYIDPKTDQWAEVKFWCPVGWEYGLQGTRIVCYAGKFPGFVNPIPCASICDTRNTTPTPESVEPPPAPDGEECPVPAAIACNPKKDWAPPKLDLTADDICKALADLTGLGIDDVKGFTALIGMDNQGKFEEGVYGSFMKAILGGHGPLIPALVQRFGKWLEDTNRKMVAQLQCNVPGATPAAIAVGVLRFLDQWFGIVPRPQMALMEQAVNFACQSNVPSGSEARAAYLADTITREVYECWLKANGDRIKENEPLLNASRTRPDAAQVSVLWRRGRINEEEYDQRQRANGVMTDADRLRIFQLSEAWPGIEDTIRFLVRDVADPNIVNRFGLDQEFEDKWQGELVRYATGAGVSGELARLYWRAHWHLPSYTQLVEMQHRLRPGRVPQNVEVTEKDVETALKQDDFLPFWVPRMMEIAKPILTRTDLVKGFNIRAISDDDFKEGLKDLGYADDKVKLLFATYEQARKIAENKRSGLPTARTMVNEYARGEIDYQLLEQWVDRVSLTPDEKKTRLAMAAEVRSKYRKSGQIKSIKRQFTHGLIDEGTAHAALIEVGVDLLQIETLMDVWRMDIVRKGKLPTAAQLCKWRNLNLITSVQQAVALRRLGWSREDAARIVAQCEMEEAERRRKAEEAAAEKARKEAEKQAKADEKKKKDNEKSAKQRA